MTQQPPPPPGYGMPPGAYPPPPPAPKKKRHLGLKIVGGLIGLFILIGIIGSIAGGGSKDAASDSTTSTVVQASAPRTTPSAQAKAPSSKAAAPKTTVTTPSTSASIGTGLGTKDASGDVVFGKPTSDGAFATAPVKITNHSSKRSDYFIDVSIESADGKTQYDTSTVISQSVEPGQTANEKATFFKTQQVPAGAKLSIKSIQRSESY